MYHCFAPVQQSICACSPGQCSDGKGEAKGKKAPNKPLKILEEDDEDLSALRDPSEKVGGVLLTRGREGGLYSSLEGGAQGGGYFLKRTFALKEFLKYDFNKMGFLNSVFEGGGGGGVTRDSIL